jgi:hypothetical protein
MSKSYEITSRKSYSLKASQQYKYMPLFWFWFYEIFNDKNVQYSLHQNPTFMITTFYNYVLSLIMQSWKTYPLVG